MMFKHCRSYDRKLQATSVLHQDETSKALDGNVIEEVQNLDDSINEIDQDQHWKRSSRKKQKVLVDA